MLDVRWCAQNPEIVKDSLRKRGKSELSEVIDELVSLDIGRRKEIQAGEALKAKRNQASIEIARLKKEGANATEWLSAMKETAAKIKIIDDGLAQIEQSIASLVMELPNVLDKTVPEGMGSEKNVEVRRGGKIPTFTFEPRTHDEIGEALGILDFKRASEVSAARFVFLKGLAAQLERALIQFMLHTHRARGYLEISPPYLVNKDSLFGTGTLPKFAEDVFHIEKYDLYLIPTAEVPVTNYHRNEILDEKDLPKKYVAFSPCFRSEAGSYGRDTKGLKRQHQFDKVELVEFSVPSKSSEALENLTRDAESILQALNLPYRVMALCGGDVGFSSARTFDLEVWSPGQNAFVEISSCSVFTDFQARRANIRFRDSKTGKVELVHTLNGSGLAVGRTLLAIMENYQKEDGSFEVPPVLEPYL